jgi:hypothetical protein
MFPARLFQNKASTFSARTAALYMSAGQTRFRNAEGNTLGSVPNQAVLATPISREETKRAVDYRKGARERRWPTKNLWKPSKGRKIEFEQWSFEL